MIEEIIREYIKTLEQANYKTYKEWRENLLGDDIILHNAYNEEEIEEALKEHGESLYTVLVKELEEMKFNLYEVMADGDWEDIKEPENLFNNYIRNEIINLGDSDWWIKRENEPLNYKEIVDWYNITTK